MLGDESNSSSLPSWVVAVGEVQDGRRGQRASRTTSGAVLGGDGGRGGQGMEALQGVPQGDAGNQSLGLGAAQLEAEAGGPASEATGGCAGGQHQAGGGGGGGAGGEEEAGEGRGAKRRRGGSGPMLQVALPAESCDLAPTKNNGLKWTYHASDHSVSTKLTGATKGSLYLRKAKTGAPLPGPADVLGLDSAGSRCQIQLEGSQNRLAQALTMSHNTYRLVGGNFAKLLRQAGAGAGTEVGLRRDFGTSPDTLPLLVLRIGGGNDHAGQAQQGESGGAVAGNASQVLQPSPAWQQEAEQGGDEVQQAITAAAAVVEGLPIAATAAAQQAQQAQQDVPWHAQPEGAALTAPKPIAAEWGQQPAGATSPSHPLQEAATALLHSTLLTLPQQPQGPGGNWAPAAASTLVLPGPVAPALDTLSEVLELLGAGGLPQEEAGGLGLHWLNTPDAQRGTLLAMAREAVQRDGSGAAADGARAAADILSCGDEEFQLQQVLAASGLDPSLMAQFWAAWLQPLPPAVRCSLRRALLRPWAAAGGPAVGHMGAVAVPGAEAPAWAADVRALVAAALRSLELAAAGAADLHPRLCEMQGWFDFEAPQPEPALGTRFEMLWLQLGSRQQRDGVHRLLGLNCGSGCLAAALELVASHMERGTS